MLPSLKLGVSYFGNRYFNHAREDLKKIARHCNFVVHTFSETDFYYHRSCLKAIFDYSKKLGLEVWVDPWGVGGVFGGESFSRFLLENRDSWQRLPDGRKVASACLNNQKFRRFLKDWITAAADIGSEVIFWDEPHQKIFQQKIIQEFLSDMFRFAKKKRLKNALCIYALNSPEYDIYWDGLASLPELDIFGCDPYWRLNQNENPVNFVKFFSRKVFDTCRRYRKEGQIWLQAMALPKGKEREIDWAAKAGYEAGIRNFAGWSYDGGAILDNVKSYSPEKVQRSLFKAFDSLQKLR